MSVALRSVSSKRGQTTKRILRLLTGSCLVLVLSSPWPAPAAAHVGFGPASVSHGRSGEAAAATQVTTGQELEDPSVLSLVEDYGTTVEQARSQMEAQVAAGRAERDLPPELLEVYSGRQIFHDRGGKVVIGLTDEARVSAVREHFARYGVGDLDHKVVAAKQKQIDDMIESTTGRLSASRSAGSAPLVEVGNSELGMVTVRVASGALNDAEAEVVRTATAAPDRYKVIRVERIPVSEEEACDFTGNIECDPPLRGSVWMTGGGRVCTAGFNTRSNSDNKPYVLTAGHCRNSSTWSTQFEDESVHNIGPFHNAQNDAETDAGIIRVNNPSGWQFGWPLVTVDPTGGEGPANEAYVINLVLNPGLGDRVCATLGNSARTDCGTVTDTSVTGGGTDGLFQVSDLCTEGGDSGSPYFASHVAYGIHSAGDGVSGTTGCQFGRAEHAIEASSRMNVHILEA